MTDLLKAKRDNDRKKKLEAIKAQFAQVQQHIQAGDYRKARKALSYFDNHPSEKVMAYAAKLESTLSEKEAAHQASNKMRGRKVQWVVMIVLLIIIGGIVYVALMQGRGDIRLKFAWREACIDSMIETVVSSNITVSADVLIQECSTQASYNVEFNLDELDYCYAQSNEAKLERRFVSCLIENNAFIDDLQMSLAIQNAR